MSLGLFNCRLIQPAGDQLFFSSAVWRHRRQFGQALSTLLVTRPPRPRPAGGPGMLLVLTSQKDFVLVFTGGEAPSLPTDSAIEPVFNWSAESVRSKLARLSWNWESSTLPETPPRGARSAGPFWRRAKPEAVAANCLYSGQSAVDRAFQGDHLSDRGAHQLGPC